MKLLDLFCGAGGAAVGYHRAGFDEIVGIDIAPQPNYPFRFIQADALAPPVDLASFDLIHASPPCQHFTALGRMTTGLEDRYGDHLAAAQSLLKGFRSVIENVPGAPMRIDVELCGSMFNLDAIRRHRWFEVGNWTPPVLVPPHNHLPPIRFKSHRRGPLAERPVTTRVAQIGSWSLPLEDQKRWMGIDWPVTIRELSEAIPPAYTEYIGRVFLEQFV